MSNLPIVDDKKITECAPHIAQETGGDVCSPPDIIKRMNTIIKEKNPNVVVEASYEKIAEALKKDAGEKDVIVTMGAGNITKLSDMLVL